MQILQKESIMNRFVTVLTLDLAIMECFDIILNVCGFIGNIFKVKQASLWYIKLDNILHSEHTNKYT